jgi:hypothetical protein
MTKLFETQRPLTAHTQIGIPSDFISTSQSGDIQILSDWTGPQSGLSFISQSPTQEHTEICVWLDDEKTIPFRAFCNSIDTVIQTTSMFDLIFAMAASPEQYTTSDTPASSYSLKLSHIMMLLEGAVLSTQSAIEECPPSKVPHVYKKALLTYTKIHARLMLIYQHNCPQNIKWALQKEKKLIDNDVSFRVN